MRKYFSFTPRQHDSFPHVTPTFSLFSGQQHTYRMYRTYFENGISVIHLNSSSPSSEIFTTHGLFYCSTSSFAQCEDSVTKSVIVTVTNTNPRMYLPLDYHLCQGVNLTAGAYSPIISNQILGRILMQFFRNDDNGPRNK